MSIRRVVTGTSAAGKSEIVADSVPSRLIEFTHLPGMSTAILWATRSPAAVPAYRRDASKDASFLPAAPGETRLVFVTFPPDSVFSRSDFDGAAAAREYMEHIPDFAARFEPSGMHTTDTVDYGIVLDGEVWLELDDGKQLHLKPHDVVIQNGTHHAWRNKTERPVTMAFVLIGAERK